MPAPRARRVAVVDGLRGLASLAVCWYHLVFASHAFDGGGIAAALLRNSARNAWIGVEVFFVISGFVIPLALYRSGYTLQSFGRFVLKRALRLDPPYLASAALSLALWWIWAMVPFLHGPPFNPKPMPLLLHLGYLNAFLGQGWLNPVYWTLAIELQYYIGIGLLFAALASASRALRLGTFALFGVLALLIPNPALVFHYLFVFMLGMVTFQRTAGLLSNREYLLTLAVLAVGCKITLGPMVAAISVLTALAIAFVSRCPRPLTALGAISYSLYLIHVPVGGRILGIGLAHVHGGAARLAVLVTTLVLTLAAAALFYQTVERPAQRWSAAIRYAGRGTTRERRRVTPHAAVGLD